MSHPRNALPCALDSLDSTPVLGVSLAGVKVLRLDQLGGSAPGNKRFKLQENIRQAERRGLDHVVSFGGAWSNHLHALAATGRALGLRTTGVVRGEHSATPSAMLVDAKRWGMQLLYVSREDYRRRDQDDFLQQLRHRLGPCYIVPEGGANEAGAAGCQEIAQLLCDAGAATVADQIVMATGTGTTLAGIARALPGEAQVVGVSVLKNALDIDQRVARFTRGRGASWQVLHHHHCGGYARVSAALKQFILAFERIHQLQLDPVYTAKAMFAIHQLLASGQWQAGAPRILVHTGGLQGRRGFSWLS